MRWLFILSCGIMFSHTLAYTKTNGYIQFPYFLKYGIAIAWFCISFFKMIIKQRGKIQKRYFKDIEVYIFPTVLMALSVIISIETNHNFTTAYLMRSISNITAFLVTILAVYGAVTLFRYETIKLSLYGLVTSTLLNIAYTIYLYGIPSVAYALINVIKASFEPYKEGTVLSNVGFSLEVADATFAYGFFFLYYLLFSGKSKERKKGLILSVLGMYIGLKRIEIAAILLAIIIFKILIEQKGVSRRTVQRVFLLSLLFASFLYLFLMKYHVGVFSFLDQSRINMYGRLRLMYELTPFYIGKGYGYVNKWLEEVSPIYYIMSVSHSDLARMYIELGMIGFIAWIYYYIISLPKYFYKRAQRKTGDIVLCFVIVLMITYLIDNTSTLFATQFSFIMIPIAYGQYEQQMIREKRGHYGV